MRRIALRTPLLLALLLLVALPRAAHAESFTVDWYLLRGRANMQIGNHKAAIEAFEKATELAPDNREAMRTLGVAYGMEGLTDKAVAQFDRFLAKWQDDPEICFQQAEYLSWSRYDYRQKDAARYLRLGLAQRDDPRQRRRLALLLGRDKATLDEALAEYEALLAQTPADETLRAEYRKLLGWDKRHLAKAIDENATYAAHHPDEFAAQYALAQLLAQDPSRRADAAALYGRLVAKRPDDAKLRLAHALLLAGLSGEEDAATAEFEAVLKRQRGDAGVHLEYADMLAKQPKNHARALAAYRDFLKRQPHDQAARLKYARLLLVDKSAAPEAARQFETVLAADPRNAEAHRGAAEAYAWLGDNDRALEHGRAAEALGRSDTQVAALTEHLGEGREPRVGLRLDVLAQPGGGDYALIGASALTFARRDVGPYATLAAALGAESYQNQDATAAGPAGELSAEYRFTQERRVDVAFGYHGIGPADRRQTWRLAYTFGNEAAQVTPGVSRELRRDSLLAVAGATMEGRPYGAARTDAAFVDVAAAFGATRIDLVPSAGVVTTAAGDRNPEETLLATVEHHLGEGLGLSVAVAYHLDAEHFQTDRSGTGPSDAEPLPGGYVSPNLLLDQSPRLVLRSPEGAAVLAWLSAGPGLQLVRTGLAGTTLVVGAEADLAASTRLSGYAAELKASYLRLPTVAGQIQATAGVAKLF